MNPTLWLLLGFVAGALSGAVGALRLFFWRLRDPDVSRWLLKTVYRRSHPHWLQRSRDDDRPVCPCCGWSETEAIAAPIDPETGDEAYEAAP